jgi:hypothetical protein
VSFVNGQPLAGVIISTAEGRFLAKTGDRGVFSFRVPAEPLCALTFTRAGFAPHVMAMEDTSTDLLLPAVRLGPGGSLRITLQRDCATPCRTRLFVSPRGNKPAVATERELLGERGAVLFERLDPGDYLVLARGEGELQQISITATVVDSQAATAAIEVHDRSLAGSLSQGGQPMAGTRINITRRDEAWSGAIVTTAQGLFELPVWDTGTILASIPIAGSDEQYRASKVLTDADRQAWDISIPARLLTGRVVDRDTGSPIAGARVVDDFAGQDASRHGYARLTDQEGVYRFAAISPGRHVLHAKADGYAGEEEAAIAVGDDADPLPVDFRLERGSRRRLQVVDADGNPVPEPFAIDAAGLFSLRALPFNGSSSGELLIPLPPGVARDLFIWTFGGSFAFARVQEQEPDDSLVVRLPAAATTLRLRVRAGDRQPLPNVGFLIRYEGRLIPPVILRTLAAERHVQPLTAADGTLILRAMPAGTYQIAAYADPRDAEAIVANPGTRFHTVIALPGEVTEEFVGQREP